MLGLTGTAYVKKHPFFLAILFLSANILLFPPKEENIVYFIKRATLYYED